jgi:hypothetical protein
VTSSGRSAAGWWALWALASAASVLLVGGIGAMAAGGGLDASGPSSTDRLVGSVLAGIGCALPIALLAVADRFRALRAKLLGAAVGLAAVVALGVHAWTA